MAYRDTSARSVEDESLAGFRTEGREPGARRKKIAGYLKAANELRQSYTQTWGTRHDEFDGSDGLPGTYPDAALLKNGEEEMLIFPSYARRHVNPKPEAVPGSIQETSGTGRDYRDTVGSGDAEFWRQQWDRHEHDNAIVDVDVRGWLFAPHKGQLNRKQRLMVALARQLVGLPAASSRSPSAPNSRTSSPQGRSQRQEEELAAQEAEAIVRKGNAEADVAGRGGFSEIARKDSDGDSLYETYRSSSTSHAKSREGSTSEPSTTLRRAATQQDMAMISSTAVHNRSSLPAPANMNPAELAVANGNLMTRLKPFMANPLANVPISAFFYNESTSRQRTVQTDPSGHFSFRAALDFVPTHVRVVGSEHLSVTEKVLVTEPKGVTLVSDIDDTIRHSAITKGAREIFRNAFIRDLKDLTVDGVREWYNKLASMGVQVHYVSNSPWQLYPVLTSFFALAGLPRGSFHLKQYSGMLQGIFEPVAERKKATLDKIMRDFPERRFILVGDSGEADLEVYTDTVMEHPGRVAAVFIRDVTTPTTKGFFDSSMGPSSNNRPKAHARTGSEATLSKSMTYRSRPAEEDDKELRAAIAASLEDEEAKKTAAGDELGDLIDFSDDHVPNSNAPSPAHDGDRLQQLKQEEAMPRSNLLPPRPQPPCKPTRLRSPSNASSIASIGDVSSAFKPPPPKPRKSSTTVQTTSKPASAQDENRSAEPKRPPPLPTRQTYRGAAKQKLTAAYNALPSASGIVPGYGSGQSGAGTNASSLVGNSSYSASPRTLSPASVRTDEEGRSDAAANEKPPPPPPRRTLSSYPAVAAQYASNRLSGTWNGYETGSDGGAQPINRKEEMWRRRWRTAKEILDKEGVLLRSWRVGPDVMDECLDLVRKEMRKMGIDE